MFDIRVMTMADYDAVIDLMRRTPGISLRDADARELTSKYSERNLGLSFVTEVGDVLCGYIMSGHDGHRGYLQHLVVLPEYRRQGIAKALVERCLSSLEKHGIQKCHLDVFKTNAAAASYWRSQGWQLRSDIDRYSFTRSDNENELAKRVQRGGARGAKQGAPRGRAKATDTRQITRGNTFANRSREGRNVGAPGPHCAGSVVRR